LTIDKVFKALGDPGRRRLLDQLHLDNGQTLTALCDGMAMTRQAVTQHLQQLEDANLVAVVWQGREKLHYLNPVPLQDIYERWIGKFERKRLGALHNLKIKLEGIDMTKPSYLYVTYIATTPEKLWQALVDTDLMRQWWVDPAAGCARVNVSDWKPGSSWEHQRTDGSGIVDMVGKVVETTPPRRLIFTWARPNEAADESKHSRVSFDVEPYSDGLVRLTVTHDGLDQDAEMLSGISGGWPKVLSNLKTFLETGRPLALTPSAS
jgi:uncharacterized protein YndB with AHSA1/START domain/DNA-binding transcriptional ArsR family regulator